MIVQPGGPLLGPFRMVLAHDDVSQPQPVWLEYGHEPTEDYQRHDLRVPVEIRRDRIGQAGHRVKLHVPHVRRERFRDAPVKIGEIALARHVDAHGTGSLDLERIDMYVRRHRRATLP